ncbi:MAG TPA: phosphoribosyltransferase family protein [Balneolales bacterium]|nr:phosphoribosyltransferase family protein [Balneolales bacterium]
MVLLPFKDRNSAGDQLAHVLGSYRGRAGLLVVGLPRGGVPVAARVAEQLDVALDVMVVRKLGTPGHEELAMGAIASGGVRVINDEIVGYMDIDQETIEIVTAREREELERRERVYRRKYKKINLEDRNVILVDDGLATGTTMMAAVQSARHEGASTLIVAVPVAPQDTINALYNAADEVVCLKTPEPFSGVGMWYDDFCQTSDEEVMALLKKARYRMREVRKQ